MGMIKLLKRVSPLLIVVIIVSAVFRLAFLDKIPFGVSNDELDYILNAKAVFLQGSDISGTWNPVSFTTPKSAFPQAEAAPLLNFLMIGILPLSIVYSKLSYILINIGIVIMTYLIARRLINEKAAFFVGIMASISPWLVFFGRTTYDTPVAIFLYLAGVYILLKATRWKILLSAPFFFFGFYSYIGTKLLLIPILLVVVFYSWYVVNKKKFTMQYGLLLLLGVALVAFYGVRMLGDGGSRMHEISNPNMEQIVDTTNDQRKLSISHPLTSVFLNKYTVFTNFSLEKYINVFSPNFLFLHGDTKGLFSVWEHGVFYLVDLLFLLIGGYFLLLKKRSQALFLIALALISPIPSVASNVGVSYAIRAFLLCPILLIFIGYGVYCTIYNSPKKYRLVLMVGVTVIYLFQITNFLNIYLFRNPVYNSESFNMSGRVLIKYLSLQENLIDTYVVSADPKVPLKQYLFYLNKYDKTSVGKVSDMYKEKKYAMDNVHFISCKDVDAITGEKRIIYEASAKCKSEPKEKFITIAQFVDSGAVYKIFGDNVCGKYELGNFLRPVSFSDLNIESLKEKDFCEKYLINYFK